MVVQQRSPQQETIALTCGAQLAWADAALAAADSPSPQLDALVLLMWLVGMPAAMLLEQPEQRLSAEHAAQYAAWVARRAEGEPVAYITGHKAFMGLDLHVDRSTLLVRSATQVLVETVLEHVRLRQEERLLAADIGTGCGAMALALASLEPRFAHLYATDCSAEALVVARRNGARYRMSERITWLEGDLLAPVPESVDVIVANLPYLPDDLPEMAPSVRRFEPPVAFFGGPDGLELLRRFIAQVPQKLRPGGTLALEMRPTQHAAIEALLRVALPPATIWAGRLSGHNDHVLVAQLDR
jgi:release factor glutamine methyltransferase